MSTYTNRTMSLHCGNPLDPETEVEYRGYRRQPIPDGKHVTPFNRRTPSVGVGPTRLRQLKDKVLFPEVLDTPRAPLNVVTHFLIRASDGAPLMVGEFSGRVVLSEGVTVSVSLFDNDNFEATLPMKLPLGATDEPFDEELADLAAHNDYEGIYNVLTRRIFDRRL